MKLVICLLLVVMGKEERRTSIGDTDSHTRINDYEKMLIVLGRKNVCQKEKLNLEIEGHPPKMPAGREHEQGN